MPQEPAFFPSNRKCSGNSICPLMSQCLGTKQKYFQPGFYSVVLKKTYFLPFSIDISKKFSEIIQYCMLSKQPMVPLARDHVFVLYCRPWHNIIFRESIRDYVCATQVPFAAARKLRYLQEDSPRSCQGSCTIRPLTFRPLHSPQPYWFAPGNNCKVATKPAYVQIQPFFLKPWVG